MKFSNSQILALILFLISFIVSLVVVFNYFGEASQLKHLITINFLIIANFIYISYANCQARKNYFNS
jgi:hypothetical protein